MEGVPTGCLKVMNWHLHLEVPNFVYPSGWVFQKNLDYVLPIKWLNLAIVVWRLEYETGTIFFRQPVSCNFSYLLS